MPFVSFLISLLYYSVKFNISWLIESLNHFSDLKNVNYSSTQVKDRKVHADSGTLLHLKRHFDQSGIYRSLMEDILYPTNLSISERELDRTG